MHWLIALSFFVTSTALAEGAPIQDIPPGEDVIEPITQGKPAPFTGQLFSQETALRWGNWLMQYKTRLVQDLRLERNICAARIQYKDELLRIEADRSATVIEDLRGRLLRVENLNASLNDEMNDPSFWSSMEFGVILGVLGASAVAVAVGVAAASN